MTVYFISGQGADEKLFENLILPPNLKIKYVQWIEPFKKETLENYVRRLSQQIESIDHFVLVGVSFGGIVAVELNKILQPKLIIIISSIATKKERPPLFRFLNFFQLHKIVPASIYKWYNPFINWYFGATTKREKELLQYYMKATTKNYMKWATNAILNWKNKPRPTNLLHIHGTCDRIFPHQFTRADLKIKNGTHLMVHSRAGEISKILIERLDAFLQ